MILALDLSFRGSGVATFDPGGKKFFLGSVVSPEKEVKSFGSVVRSVDGLAKILKNFLFLKKVYLEDSVFVVESPPPRAVYSSGMWALSVGISGFLLSQGFKGFYCSPMFVKSVLGSRKATKSDSVSFAGNLFNVLSHDFEFYDFSSPFSCVNFASVETIYSPLKDHNVCEAFIILCSYLRGSYLKSYNFSLPLDGSKLYPI